MKRDRAKPRPEKLARPTSRLEEAAAVRRWRSGQLLAAERQRRLIAEEGAQPDRAVAESLSALNALADMGLWPAPRDPVSEQAVQEVRRRWARIQHRAKQARTG